MERRRFAVTVLWSRFESEDSSRHASLAPYAAYVVPVRARRMRRMQIHKSIATMKLGVEWTRLLCPRSVLLWRLNVGSTLALQPVSELNLENGTLDRIESPPEFVDRLLDLGLPLVEHADLTVQRHCE